MSCKLMFWFDVYLLSNSSVILCFLHVLYILVYFLVCNFEKEKKIFKKKSYKITLSFRSIFQKKNTRNTLVKLLFFRKIMRMIFNTNYWSNLTYYFFIQYILAVKRSHVKKYFWQVIEMINSKW